VLGTVKLVALRAAVLTPVDAIIGASTMLVAFARVAADVNDVESAVVPDVGAFTPVGTTTRQEAPAGRVAVAAVRVSFAVFVALPLNAVVNVVSMQESEYSDEPRVAKV
jgi:hypothetical protein